MENKKSKSNFAKMVEANWRLYVLMAPLMIWLFLFAYKPMGGLVIAFQDYNLFRGISGSDWIGFDNFKELFSGSGSMYFWRAFNNTIAISMYSLIFTFPLPIILALFFNEVKDGLFRRGVQTIMFLPHFLSEVILAGIVVSFLQPETGIINIFLMKLGILDEGIYFLMQPEWFRPVYILAGVWKEVGFSSIVYFAALSAISPEQYEAARVDGATKLQQMRFVSLPGIGPTIITMFIIKIGNLLSVGFERVILLYQPVTYDTADVLSTYIYRLGLTGSSDFSMAAAAGLFNSVIGFVLVIAANTISKKLSDTVLW
ncbi:MAG: sugar ABC transporter permease [Epulopiscium sp. Nele67-Bin004]|nr:MAG: sugar ABC transporter permease [Epulopiscium sp. Nele67-Bin004]